MISKNSGEQDYSKEFSGLLVNLDKADVKFSDILSREFSRAKPRLYELFLPSWVSSQEFSRIILISISKSSLKLTKSSRILCMIQNSSNLPCLLNCTYFKSI